LANPLFSAFILGAGKGGSQAGFDITPRMHIVLQPLILAGIFTIRGRTITALLVV
jgi:hypothetical protein